MTPQFLGEKMCRLLSSFAPGFEGHYVYVIIGGYRRSQPVGPDKVYPQEVRLMCQREREGLSYAGDNQPHVDFVPAWQVEDVLRNWEIIDKNLPDNFIARERCERMAMMLVEHGDTAYQKIEEYLWTKLK